VQCLVGVQVFASFVKFTTKYFVLSDAIVNGISFLDGLLLVRKDTFFVVVGTGV
jgi:hypothetical protein